MGGRNTVPMPEGSIRRIQAEVSEHPVIMYTKASCGYCQRAKRLLDDERVVYVEKDLDAMNRTQPQQSYEQYVNGLVCLTKQTSVPQVFICGKFIGGFTELKRLKDVGRLFDSITECADQHGRADPSAVVTRVN